MKKLLFSFVLVFCSVLSYGLTYTVTVPEGTVECYIAGDNTGWSQTKMTEIGANRFEIDIPTATTSHGYKYCSGPGWGYVEKGPQGQELGNRKYSADDVVATWLAVYDPRFPKGDITITATVPEDTPENVYIVGSFQGFNLRTAIKMTSKGSNQYEVVIPSVTQITYKLVCGKSWDNVEVAADGELIGDRTADTANPDVNITVERWMSTEFIPEIYTYVDQPLDFQPYLAGTRKIWVYLPPNYHTETSKKFPVLYMHDGQNVFENGGYGSWEAHNAFNRLYAEGHEVGIVVAIDNGTGRMSEYTPFPNATNAPVARGNEYLDAIINVVMPYVNENYRTLTGPENTGIAGSSLGGLISYYAGLKHPDVFGKIGAISPSFWYCENTLRQYLNEWSWNGDISKSKIYFICGSSEGSTTMVPLMEEFYDKTKGKGFAAENLSHEVVQGGGHNESSWAAQIERVYEFLFITKAEVSVNENVGAENLINVAVSGKDLTVENKADGNIDFSLFDVTGKLVSKMQVNQNSVISNLNSGVYIYKAQLNNNYLESKKIIVH